jgi:uroporphyrinogen-III synthase
MAMRAIWVTRAEPGAGETAARLRALGFEAVVAPLLTIQPVANAAIDLTGVAALAFTSPNAVRAFAELSPERALRVFAVGDATARAAQAARFRTVLSTNGDVKAMAAGIATRQRELAGGAVLHPGAAEPAGDLKGALAKHGIATRAVALYESVPAQIPTEVIEQLPHLYGVLVHSPKGARALAGLLKTHPAPQLIAWCISKAAARPLAKTDLARVLAAPAPKEEALLGLVQ